MVDRIQPENNDKSLTDQRIRTYMFISASLLGGLIQIVITSVDYLYLVDEIHRTTLKKASSINNCCNRFPLRQSRSTAIPEQFHVYVK